MIFIVNYAQILLNKILMFIFHQCNFFSDDKSLLGDKEHDCLRKILDEVDNVK